MSHVFCFDVPIHAEDYVHRIGRTGRAGRSGRSFMLAAPEDGRAVAAITKLIGKEIPLSVIPGIEAAELEYEQRRGRGARNGPRPVRTRDATRPAKARAGATGSPQRNRPSSTRSVPLPNGNSSNGILYPIAAETHRAGSHERKGQEASKVIGFGDDLPAFLSRPPRIVARP